MFFNKIQEILFRNFFYDTPDQIKCDSNYSEFIAYFIPYKEISIPHKINNNFPNSNQKTSKNAKKRRRRFLISLIFSLKHPILGGFGGSRSSRSRSTSQSPPRPAPKYTPAPAQQAPQRGGMMSGLGGMVMTGMALGAGSEIAHQGVRGLMGGI